MNWRRKSLKDGEYANFLELQRNSTSEEESDSIVMTFVLIAFERIVAGSGSLKGPQKTGAKRRPCYRGS
jgi:hypothetical protein